ncbi:non-ribosomal peptide synthetase [Opitutus sp. GAS368]|uniref:non-ribosomal peptide synthetase n=1 Tax=Opitutus sp. GAS368 TaxID=1882749 RepID=UPI00087C989F|nr:non-ribosomal peptide synthetase [Opitutus sp. GAS368]SDS42519.1 amino acid adenylation domain-containing protein [Opitutus sp. GAS368]
MPTALPTDSYPLSPMQQGMLFHSLYARRPGVDVEQLLITLPEALKMGPFERAWRWAAQRHAILRTAFRWENADQPVQAVHADCAPEIVWRDWRALAAADVERQWEELIAADRHRGFNLDTPPLWRLAVVQTGPREHRLLFSFHHLLLDGRGLVVLLTEVFAAYGEKGEPAAAPPVAYRDYIDWLQVHDWRDAELFWRRVLRGMIAPTALPGALPLADPDTAVHRAQEVVLSAGRTAELKQLAQHHGLTLNTLVQGAWALLLGRYSGEDTVVFGAVRACRHTTIENAESIVGLLINTVPLRVALPPEQPAVAWLQQLREHWISLRPYENTPLAEIQGWTEVPRGTPLFESIVNYQEPSWDAALKALGGAWRRRRFGVRSQPNYPLALDAAGGATLSLKILYDPRRFETEVVGRMLGHLETLLRGIAEHPQMPLGQLPLLTTAERHQVLVGWNRTQADYADDLCVHHLFEAQAARTPAAVAVVDQRRHLTYRDLDAEAGALARQLLPLGVGPDVCVGLCLPRSVDLVVAALAVLKAGGAYVPLDPDSPMERLAGMLEDTQAPVLITQRKLAPLFSAGAARVLLMDGLASAPQPERAGSDPAVPGPDHLAYVIYTSGSTGTPKGVAIQHRSVANLIAWHQRTYQITPADRTTLLASPSFDASVWEMWPYLASGASIHIPPEEIRLDPGQLVTWLANRQITLCFLPTPMAEAVMDESWPADIALRAILTGGDRLRRWPGERLPCMLVNHYGPTENTVVATWMPVPPEAAQAPVPLIGAPIANTQVYVLDPQRQPLPVGVPGELYVGGVGLARGYHRRSDLTREKFVPHPFQPGARLYRTGDLVRWLPGGHLEFLGRLDQQIKIRGHRIEPGEIESLLNTHARVRESLVTMREDGAGQTHLIAYVMPPPGDTAPAPRELAALLRARLPAYMLPAAFVAVAGWPLTTNGKVDRARLPAPDRLGYDSAPPFAPPQGEIEETIARIWTEVLGRAGIGAQDDFFCLGGHSLRAAQVVSRLNAAFQLTLSVRSLFEHPTVTALAEAIEQAVARGPVARPASPLVRAPRQPYRATPGGPARSTLTPRK